MLADAQDGVASPAWHLFGMAEAWGFLAHHHSVILSLLSSAMIRASR